MVRGPQIALQFAAQKAEPPEIDLVAGRCDYMIGRNKSFPTLAIHQAQLHAPVAILRSTQRVAQEHRPLLDRLPGGPSARRSKPAAHDVHAGFLRQVLEHHRRVLEERISPAGAEPRVRVQPPPRVRLDRHVPFERGPPRHKPRIRARRAQ